MYTISDMSQPFTYFSNEKEKRSLAFEGMTPTGEIVYLYLDI